MHDDGMISYHALSGQLIPQTLRFSGQVNGQQMTILVDSGSTHNFVQTRIAKHLGFTVVPIANFGVMIGNGSKLCCEGQRPSVSFEIQGLLFTETFYVLPL